MYKLFEEANNLRLFEEAKQKAIEYGHQYVTTEHVLSILLDKPEIQTMISKFSVEHSDLKNEVTDYLSTAVQENFIPPLKIEIPAWSSFVHVMIKREILIYTMTSGTMTESNHTFLYLFDADKDNFCSYLFEKYGLKKESLEKYVDGRYREKFYGDKGKETENGMPELAKYAVNLNEKAAKLKIDPLIGRAEEIYAVTQAMGRYKKNSVMLVGGEGVGKTAIVEGLALNIVNGNVPESLMNATIYSLDIAALVAGTRYRGEFEERMKLVLEELKNDTDAVLFIDEIHMVMAAGGSGDNNVNAANLLKPALARGEIRCIGSTTFDEYRKHIEKDKALCRRFKVVSVDEPSIKDAKEILQGLKSYYENFHGIHYDNDALDAAVDLSAKYIKGHLPDKALDLIDDAGTRVKLTGIPRNITVLDIEEEVAVKTKTPRSTVSQSELDRLEALKPELESMLFGQTQAIESLDDAMWIIRAGLREPNKPAAAFLFAGPTGVGKTETARQLAKRLDIPLFKEDMSEYMEKHSVSKFIGAAPGYVGYGDGSAGSGKLINEVDEHPHCVVLLDEFEKAHPDVQNIFLQIMDDGILTSSAGKPVSFRNVYLIFSTNAGSTAAANHKPMGFLKDSGDNGASSVQDKVINDTFSPEFRNRLDAIVRFNSLKAADMEHIVNKFIGELNVLASEKGFTIAVSEEVVKYLAVEGYDPKFGARPLKRAIDNHIKKPLSRRMVRQPNDKAVSVEMRDGVVVIL